nr:Oxidoreductase molybdopterin binding domain [uncultured organism]
MKSLSKAGAPASAGRRRILAGSGAVIAAGLAARARATAAPAAAGHTGPSACTTVPDTPTVERPPPQVVADVFSTLETELAFRNHGMHAEFLRQPLTPLGSHYLLVHFDIPTLEAGAYTLQIGGRVRQPLRIGLQELNGQPVITQTVTMECAGTGRATLDPRPVYVPWFKECMGTYEWTGTRLRSLLERAGLLGDAVEVLFTGWDSGVDLGVEHAFERSLPLADALRDEVMLAWAANGRPLLPQHGFPLRLVVPSWYGMASVKWLRAITVLSEPFLGMQQHEVYMYRQRGDDPGTPVRSKRVNSLIAPPGMPDMLSRHRFVAPGRQLLEGKAWSGAGGIVRVQVSADDGASWSNASLSQVAPDPWAWVHWRYAWNATPGEHVLACRALDAAGNQQPLDPGADFNIQGNAVNAVQRMRVTVQAGIGSAAATVPSRPRRVLPGAELPPMPAAGERPG